MTGMAVRRMKMGRKWQWGRRPLVEGGKEGGGGGS